MEFFGRSRTGREDPAWYVVLLVVFAFRSQLKVTPGCSSNVSPMILHLDRAFQV